MRVVLDIGVGILHLVPLILAFYLPVLISTVIWNERGDGYGVKAAIWFVVGCGFVTWVHVSFTSSSALQVSETLLLSLVEIAAALGLAIFTVRRLADGPTGPDRVR